ncbi:glycosyltransferase family 4 protein [Haloarcula laminariae]|uniref:glycosyltransferase family 4 protein n=1 Tax=Haloarcula laminariae TaxID=2961577 RepID=UPI0024051B1C|nr:glycosyltransferase family 4 protein [Halomicroarcula sp. FL173]
MKILIITNNFYPETSGGAHVQWGLARRLAKRHDVTVITSKDTGTAKFEKEADVTIVRPLPSEYHTPVFDSLLNILGLAIFSLSALLYSILRLPITDFDIVYTPTEDSHWIGHIFSYFEHVTHVSFVGYSPCLKPDAGTVESFIEKMNFRFFLSERALCQTNQVKEQIERFGSEGQILCGVLETDTLETIARESISSDMRRQLDITQDDILFASVGRITENKNVVEAVQIFSNLPEEYHLIIVGDGPERKAVEEAIEDSGIGNRVHVVGKKPHKETLRTMRESDGLILTSKAESSPLVILESLALGSYVVATPVGILPDIEHSNLILSEPEDMGSAIKTIEYTNPCSIDWSIIDEYSVDRFAEDVEGIFYAEAR